MKIFNVQSLQTYLKSFSTYLKSLKTYLKSLWSKFYIRVFKSRNPENPDTFNNFNPVTTYEQLHKLLINNVEPTPLILQKFLSNIFNESMVRFSSMPSTDYVPTPKYASESDKINFILSHHFGIGPTILSVNHSIYPYYCLAYAVLNIYNHRMPSHFETAFRFYYNHFDRKTYEFDFH